MNNISQIILLSFCTLIISSILVHAGHDQYVISKQDEARVGHVPMRRNVLNASLSEVCPRPQCNALVVNSNITYDVDACETTLCYTIMNGGAGNIASFGILGVDAKKAVFEKNATLWSIGNFGRFTYLGTQASFSNQTYCFTVSGKFDTMPSKMFLDLGNYICEAAVNVINTEKPCSSDCILDKNFANARCRDCNAACPNFRTASIVTGQETCTLSIKVSPTALGTRCNSETLRRCTTTCPVDCAYAGPIWNECSANCQSQTVTQTGYYSITQFAVNGGSPCVAPIPKTRLCSMPLNELTTLCRKDCLVVGNAFPSCQEMCKNTNETTVTYVYSFTQTAQTPTLGGAACPTGTTSCICPSESCVLQPYPTSTGTCGAECQGYQGLMVRGLQAYHYPVSVTGQACVTVSYKACSTMCPCSYTTATRVENCVATKTITTATPWVISGFQKYRAQGTADVCEKVYDVPCTSTLAPKNCIVASDCRKCSCTPTSGPAYTLTTPITCTYTLIQTPDFGGTACPNSQLPQTCQQLCPGCEEEPGQSVCYCRYTSESTVGTVSRVLNGTKECIYPLKTNFPFCTTRTERFLNQPCNTTQPLSDPICTHTLASCDEQCTPTATRTNQLPYTIDGYKTCSFHPNSLSMSSCSSTSISTINCSRSLAMRDCSVTYSCPTPTVSCPYVSTSNKVTTSKTCSVVTLSEAQNGGQCTFPTEIVSAHVADCSPKPESYQIGYWLSFHTFFFGHIVAYQSVFQGRLVVAGNATLDSVTVGIGLFGQLNICDASPSAALVVQGCLKMIGTVYNGETKVVGICEGDITSKCKVTCAPAPICPTSRLIDPGSPLHLSQLQTFITLQSQLYATMNQTAKKCACEELGAASFIEFSGNPIWEVVEIPHDDVVTKWWAGYRGNLASTSTIVFNLRGNGTISLTGLSLEHLLPLKERLVWNFPEAKEIILSTMSLPGMVLAPYAKIRGNGTFYGPVFANELRSVLTSPTFLASSFTGKWASLP